MVQYLHFRILKFPLIQGASHAVGCTVYRSLAERPQVAHTDGVLQRDIESSEALAGPGAW